MNSTATRQWPVIARPGVGLVLVSETDVGTVQRQQAFSGAFRSAWEGAEWPRGLISVSLFAGTAGDSVLTFAQWQDEDSYRSFASHILPARREKIAAAVPGVRPAPPIVFRLFRERRSTDGAEPQCLVVVRVEFDRPDADRQIRWVNAVFDALERERALPSGSLSSYFYVSTDSKQLLNYAEWTSEQAHQAALGASGQGMVGTGQCWLDVRHFPGVVTSELRRYRLLESFSLEERS